MGTCEPSRPTWQTNRLEKTGRPKNRSWSSCSRHRVGTSRLRFLGTCHKLSPHRPRKCRLSRRSSRRRVVRYGNRSMPKADGVGSAVLDGSERSFAVRFQERSGRCVVEPEIIVIIGPAWACRSAASRALKDGESPRRGSCNKCRILVDVRQNLEMRRAGQPVVGSRNHRSGRRQVLVDVMVSLTRQSDLLEIIYGLHTCHIGVRDSHGRNQQRRQNHEHGDAEHRVDADADPGTSR